MALRKSQQIAISVILGLTVLGTVGSFFVIALENSNQQKDQATEQAELTKYQNDEKAYQAKVNAQAATLSKQYYPTFSKYASLPAAFDKATITALKTTDLVVGSGAAVTDTTNFATYYLGWTPDGKVFDGSISGQSLKAPFAINGLASGGVIEGWSKGLVGMHIGGVRELSIPSAEAYGSTGTTGIPANTPLKFVVMAITQPPAIAQPQIPTSLLESGALQ